MHRSLTFLYVLMLLGVTSQAATKSHMISFGKTTNVKWFVGADESQAIDLKIRALYVDGRLKEFTASPLHDVTDRIFVIQRAFRINDTLPQEKTALPQWHWQRGGWLLVDRLTGRISPLAPPLYDAYYSSASWYRDYVAYCGLSQDGKKVYAIVSQLGRRKPILKQLLGSSSRSDMPDSICAAPVWQRPSKVSFESNDENFTYSIRGHSADMVDDAEDEGD